MGNGPDPLLSFFDGETRRSVLKKGAAGLAIGSGMVGASGMAAGGSDEDNQNGGREDKREFSYPPIDFTVVQESGKSVHWVLPGKRRLSEYTFGTPDTPYMTPDHWIDIADESIAEVMRKLPVEGVELDNRAVNEAGDAFTTTTFKNSFSDKAETVDGELEVVYKDRQPHDTESPTEDDAEIDVQFTDPSGNEYTIELKRVIQPVWPNYESGGGVFLNSYFHGITGTGTPLEPRQLGYGALWGLCDLLIDGEVVGENRAVHVMSTQVVRNEEYDLAITPELPLSDDEAYLGRDHATHFIMPPVKIVDGAPQKAPVPTAYTLPNGKDQPFIHVMYDEDVFADLSIGGRNPGPKGPNGPKKPDSKQQ